MKHIRILLSQAIITSAVLIPGAAAHATGLAANTQIQNTATATYTAGATTTSVNSNTVTIKVDELLNVAVASLSSIAAPASATPAILTFSVTNTGNGNEAFYVTADPNVAGNSFVGTIQTVAYDTNGDGVYTPGVDTIITNGAAIPSLAADASIKVFVLVSLPGGATDGQTSQVRLTAAAVTGTGAPGKLFPGLGDGGVDAVVGLSGASSNALASLVATLANLTLTKSYTILDPFGTANPVPGSVVTYKLVTHTTGSGTANAVHITDTFPVGTTYQTNTMTLDSAPLTDVSDVDSGVASGTGIDVTLGNVAGGSADKTITFKVKIN